jgi:serine/threonine protein kinase
MAASSSKFNNWKIEEYGKIIDKIYNKRSISIYTTSKDYIFKVINEENKYDTSFALTEIALPTHLDHEGIIKYHDVYFKTQEVVFVMDKYDGDLKKLGFLTTNQFKSISFQLITTLAYLTSRNIIHRDIKPQNIFYKKCSSSDIKCVLSDFGISTDHECLIDTEKEEVFTLLYRPLEALLQIGKYTSQADVWALGCTLYELYHGIPLFNGRDRNSMIKVIAEKIGGINPESFYYNAFKEVVDDYNIQINNTDFVFSENEEINDLLKRMIVPDPDLRESIFRLQYHPFFADVAHMCYTPYIIESNQCIDRVKLFDRHFNFTRSPDPQVLKKLLIWVRKLCIYILKISIVSYSLIIELLQRYIIKNNLLDSSKYDLITICIIYHVLSFHSRDIYYRFQYLTNKVTSGKYDDKTIDMYYVEIPKNLEYDFVQSTQHDKILIYRRMYSSDIIRRAEEILINISIHRKLYFFPYIGELCIYSSLPDSEKIISPFREKFHSVYEKYKTFLT